MFGTPISNGIDVPRSDRCTFRLDSDVQKSGEILSATYPGKIRILISRKKMIKNKQIVHSNLDVTNKSIRPFLFTISNVICLVNPQNGSWV